MRFRPAHCLVLVLLASCASETASTSTDAPRAESTVRDGVVADTESNVPLIDAGTGAYGDLRPDDARAILATYSDEGRESASTALTRTVSFQSPGANDGRRIVTALRLRNGKLLAGRVVSDDGNVVEFQFETETGMKGTTSVKYGALHPDSVADLMLARAGERDAGALMDVAEYAVTQGMYDVARVSYLAAAQADPDVLQIAEARLVALADQVSVKELARGESAAISGDDHRARRILRRVQREFAGMPAADSAAAAVAAIDARLAEQKIDARRQKQLTPIQKLLDDSLNLTGKGLQRADRPTTAIRSYLLARSKTTSARRKVGAAQRMATRSGDAEMIDSLDDFAARLDLQERDNEIQLGTSYLDKGDYSRARTATRAALAIDNKDEEALSLLTRIGEAEEESRYDNYNDYYNGYWGVGSGVGWYRWRRHRSTAYPRGWYPGRGHSWGGIHRGGIRNGGIRGGGISGGGRRTGIRVGGAIRR